jgi:tetratricopeptide (TPR) repeat protein
MAIGEEDDSVERSNHVHREILQLGALILAAIAAFILTREVAASNRETSLRDAEEWYTRGQQDISSGRLEDAVEAYRHATVRNRSDRRYVLALARALALDHDDEAARGALLTLRESAPEDAEVNLELARLEARRGDYTSAARFYHNALYAPWPADREDDRRRVRIELIKLLLTVNKPAALPELLAVPVSLPDEAAPRIEMAQLFAEAGDSQHSLEQFQAALRLAPNNGAALAGAGRNAFLLGDYSLARTYLRRAPGDLDDVQTTLGVVDVVLSNDPLARQIGSRERRRRLLADFSYARERLTMCLGQRPAEQLTDRERRLLSESEALGEQLKTAGTLEQDTIEAGVDLCDRIAREASATCGPPTAFDRALILIGRQHGGDSR